MRTEFTVRLQREQRRRQYRKASNTSTPVSSTFQQKIGIRNIVMPGARMQMIVVMKLTEPRIVPKPEKAKPMIHISAPIPGECTESESGA